MRERIEQVGDILLAAAHADHHVEAAEIDKIEAILKTIWRQEPSPDSLVRRVTEFREGEAVDAGEMARLGSMLRDLQPRGEELPSSLVQRLADFDPARFDIDEAVGPFLHESVEFKRKLLELAVDVHESDGELDFAEDTFVRELGFKLGLELRQFQDLLLEFLPADAAAPAAPPVAANDSSASKPDWAALDDTDMAEQAEARDLVSSIQTELLVPTPGGEPGNLLVPTRATGRPRSNGVARRRTPAAETRALPRESKPPAMKAKTPGKRKATKEPGARSARKQAPAAKKKAPVAKKKAAKKAPAKKKKAPAKKKKAPVAKKKAAKKKAPAKKKSKKAGK